MASAHATAPDPTSVYRYYDVRGMLIYVGITRQGMGRNVQHNGKAEWWPFVVRQEVEHLDSRPAALAREKELIGFYRPPFNKQHNPDHELARAAYLQYVARQERPESPPGLFHQLKKRLPLEVMSYEAGQLVLRSYIDHGPLAAAIKLQKETVPVRGTCKVGRLVALRLQGPVGLFTCALNKKAPDGIAGARALLGWSQNTKPQFPWIRQINIYEADHA